MEKEIRKVADGVVRITTYSERWYAQTINNLETSIPEVKFFPSVTWIGEFYPKGIFYMKWLASKGWDEAEAIKTAAGDKGSKVHLAIAKLLENEEVRMDEKFINKETGEEEELSVEEYECIMTFVRWFQEYKPEIIAGEQVVINQDMEYAGTIDFVCKIKGELYIVDFKTGQYIWPSHELQLSAYKHAFHKWQDAKLAILQLGYGRNQNGYKFTDINDKFELFLAAYKIWEAECANIHPQEKDYPMRLSLKIALDPKKSSKKKS